jgi:hypothetical protein
VAAIAQPLLDERGCGALTAAKLIARSPASSDSPATPSSLGSPAWHRSRHRRDAPPGTASTAAATASSTARCTASPSPRAAWTPTPPPTSRASRPKARAAAKRCAASNATSPAASGDCCNHQPTSAQPRFHRPRPNPGPRSPSTATPYRRFSLTQKKLSAQAPPPRSRSHLTGRAALTLPRRTKTHPPVGRARPGSGTRLRRQPQAKAVLATLDEFGSVALCRAAPRASSSWWKLLSRLPVPLGGSRRP